jgi:hypothetical protein
MEGALVSIYTKSLLQAERVVCIDGKAGEARNQRGRRLEVKMFVMLMMLLGIREPSRSSGPLTLLYIQGFGINQRWIDRSINQVKRCHVCRSVHDSFIQHFGLEAVT